MGDQSKDIILSIRGMSKSFGRNRVLDHINLDVRKGTVMGLMGENGAGKSTMMKCLFGTYQKDEGTIYLDGKEVNFSGPKDALENGIAMVHQELNQCLERNVVDNLFLGRYPVNSLGMIDEGRMKNEASELFRKLGMTVNLDQPMRNMSVSQRQMCEIAKAISYNSKVIVLDEPTSSLTVQEVDKLFDMMRMLRDQGISLIYISHKMDEIFEICDDISVLRDGNLVMTKSAKETNMNELITAMVGRVLENRFPPVDNQPKDVILSIQHLSTKYEPYLQDVTFDVREGEIFGLYGLVGAGRTELLAYYFSIRNLERMSLQVSDTVSIQMYRAACQKKHVRRIPELRQNAGLTTPLLAGLLHTKLYLPATGYSAEERKLIFYHELTHYCHRDLWYKMLLRICASIYWFNPFLLIMLKEADKDIENLCDTAVVRRVNKKEHKLYRQLLLRTVAMENQIPYVTASLNDSEMVFKDRILYMVNIRKLRKGILPGILVTLLLAGGNLVFNVSAGTDTVSVETEKSGIEKNADPEKNNVPDYAPFSEMVTMQKAAETQDEGGVTENTDTEDSVDEEEKADAETNDEPAMENSGQVSETTDDGITSDNNGSVSSYENLPAGVPYTSGFTTTSGVASIVAPGGGDEESRVLYDNGDGTYSDYYGSRYSYQGDGNWADANGNSYRTWNDEGYHFGNQLEQHELQGSNGTVNVIETTNGDYYYCDADGVGYTDNGDGTWTDENGNIYTE